MTTYRLHYFPESGNSYKLARLLGPPPKASQQLQSRLLLSLLPAFVISWSDIH